jgi:5'-3' exonuclease
MGVPGFFVWLLKNYKTDNIILTDIKDITIDTLYIDANCLFHPQCFNILNNNPDETDKNKLEKLMIKQINAYLDYIINYTSVKSVYIAVDGVAPRAKINQQRQRRFKSITEKQEINIIKDKYNKPYNKIWDNTCITPGTVFMEKLHMNLLDYISKKNINITYSSYHTPGEGEHKILQDIKKPENINKTNIIYGLDADLIFLALSSGCKNIYLLREESQFNNKNNNGEDKEKLNYFSVNNLRLLINTHMTKLCDNKQDKDFTHDYIFICYLLGNDFLPHIPSIDIKINGLELLLDSYALVYKKLGSGILDVSKSPIYINNNFLELFLKALGDNEDYFFRRELPGFLRKMDHRVCKLDPGYEQDIWNYDNLRDIKPFDPIGLGFGSIHDYKSRYYTHYFNKDCNVYDICREYIIGLSWVTKYYFDKAPSYQWGYKYLHAPLMSDIARYFNNKKIQMHKFSFVPDKPIDILTQLLLVLPPQSSYLLPNKYKKLLNDFKKLYPEKVELDCINQCMRWKCVAYVPIVDDQDLKIIIKNLDEMNNKITSKEKIRNITTHELHCNY